MIRCQNLCVDNNEHIQTRPYGAPFQLEPRLNGSRSWKQRPYLVKGLSAPKSGVINNLGEVLSNQQCRSEGQDSVIPNSTKYSTCPYQHVSGTAVASDASNRAAW